MRNSTLLHALFPRVRADILSACMLQPDKWWYLSELAQHVATRPSSLQRDVKALVATGILEQRRDGRRAYIKANTNSSIYPELRGLMEKTSGILTALQLLLEPFREKIVCAFVFGSFARATEHSGSDIDLMIVGELGLADLARSLRDAEQKLAREINANVFTAEEFQERAGEHFLKAVLGGRKVFVKGTPGDLDQVIGGKGHSKAHHVKA